MFFQRRRSEVFHLQHFAEEPWTIRNGRKRECEGKPIRALATLAGNNQPVIPPVRRRDAREIAPVPLAADLV